MVYLIITNSHLLFLGLFFVLVACTDLLDGVTARHYKVVSEKRVSYESKVEYLRSRTGPFSIDFTSKSIPLVFYGLRVLLNGESVGQFNPVIQTEKEGDQFVYASPVLGNVSPNDTIEIFYDVANFVRPVKLKVWNITRSEFFYPYDKYYFNITEGPKYYNKNTKIITIPEAFEYDENESYFRCPNNIGNWVTIPLRKQLP